MNAREVYEELQAAYTDGDVERTLRLFDDACVIHEAPDLPFGGKWVGREGVRALMDEQARQFSMRATTLGIYEVDQSRVISHTSMAMTSKTTGETNTVSILEIYTVRNGLVVEAIPHYWNAGALGSGRAGTS